MARPSGGKATQKADSTLTQRIILSNVRHELRIPLNAIIGYSEMLMEDAQELEQEQFVSDLKKICSAGKETLALLNEILDPANVENEEGDEYWENLEGKLEHLVGPPLEAVKGTSESLVTRVKKVGQEAFIPDLEKILSASKDFLRLSKDIVNLPKLKAALGDNKHEVADSSGIIKDMVSRISPLGEEEVPSTVAGRCCILVVEDNDMNRDLLTRHLERQGHIIRTAENGRQALEIMKEESFDLVLLDVLMPEMNGYQVLKRLKQEEGWRDIPVIMISALEEKDIVVRCIEMGADDYMGKPFNPVFLKARINSCLERKRLRDLEKEQERVLREAFGRYMDEEIRDEVLSGRIPLEGEIKDVTVMFADLRNFTPLTESTPPKAVVRILNDYFTEMAPAIHRHHGSLLRYVGDEIYAVFGAPLPLKDHPCHALEAALEMRRLLVVVNEKVEGQGSSPLTHGIGIHSGPVVAANIGSPDRLAYDLVGDTVNLASRIQGLTKKLNADILISATTKACLTKDFAVEKLPSIKVKGKRDPMDIYKVL
jgi:adenylate cyclase